MHYTIIIVVVVINIKPRTFVWNFGKRCVLSWVP